MEATAEELKRDLLELNKHGFIEFVPDKPGQILITKKGLICWAILDTLQGGDLENLLK